MSTTLPIGHYVSDDHDRSADGYLWLRAAAEIFEDVQRTRIAVGNRLTKAPLLVADQIRPHLAGLEQSEHDLRLNLGRVFRAVVDPDIVAWQKESVGIGEHLLARLLGSIGHPVYAQVHAWEGSGADRQLVVVGDLRRNVAKLWAYCGHGDPARRAHRGMSAKDAAALGSPQAKMIVHLLAESCLKAKARSPYGPVYDTARVRYADRLHAAECVRCGPSGRPAPEGSPWSLAHQHAAALRLVGKEILRDLWTVAGGPQA